MKNVMSLLLFSMSVDPPSAINVGLSVMGPITATAGAQMVRSTPFHPIAMIRVIGNGRRLRVIATS